MLRGLEALETSWAEWVLRATDARCLGMLHVSCAGAEDAQALGLAGILMRSVGGVTWFKML